MRDRRANARCSHVNQAMELGMWDVQQTQQLAERQGLLTEILNLCLLSTVTLKSGIYSCYHCRCLQVFSKKIQKSKLHQPQHTLKCSDCEMYLPELQLSVYQRMLYTKNVHKWTSQLWILSVKKNTSKIQSCQSILHKQLQHPMKSTHTFSIYTRIITEHSRVPSCLVHRIISTLILLHIFSITSAPKLGSHEIPDWISHGGCKSQIFQHAQKASGSTQCGNSKSLSTPT